MIDLKIEELTSVEMMKTALVPLLQDPDYNFNWLKPIVTVNLDVMVIAYLNKFPPVTTAFITLDLSEHMKEATSLLNSCTSLRNEMFELESRALLSAIEYNQIIKTVEADKLLSTLNLAALLSQSGKEESEEYTDAVQKKYDATTFSLAAKFSQHNQSGNALNYGERITFLREMYCDNIKNVYERIIAIKRTLFYSFNQITDPIPNYIEVSNSLEVLVKWMRQTIYAYETISQYDYLVVKTISFANLSIKKGLKLEDQFKMLADNGYCDIEISDGDLGVDEKKFRPRIIGVSMNIVGNFDMIDENGTNAPLQGRTTAIKSNNEMKREAQLFFCQVKTPKQNLALNNDVIFSNTADEEVNEQELIKKIQKNPKLLLEGEEFVIEEKNGAFKIKLKPAPEDKESIVFPDELIFGELQPIYKSSVTTNQNFRNDVSVKNCSPYGLWRTYIKNVTSLAIEPQPKRLDDKDWGIKDITLTFRLSVRQNRFPF